MRFSMAKICRFVVTGLAFTALSFAANRPIYKSLYSFQGAADGGGPYSLLVVHNGSLYGTTSIAGDASCGYDGGGCGTVFELSPPTIEGGAWTETTLYAFQGGSDGLSPMGPVAFDSEGNLYGTTYVGGGTGTGCGDTSGCGTVFRLSPPATSGGSWTESILYSFQGGNDGAFPEGSLALDGAGNVYGTTTQSGNGASSCNPFNCGTVFELSPPSVSGGTWTETILHRFTGGSDGALPFNVVLGANGTIYGVANDAGAANGGTVYELTPSGGSFTFNVIYDFPLSTDGRAPVSLFMHQGALYGETALGPGDTGWGTVFRLTKSGSAWNETVLFTFPFNDSSTGFSPNGGLAFDNSGNIYGTTGSGGPGPCNFGCGTVFELSPGASGYTETVLHGFQGNDGHFPEGVVFSNHTLYGTCSQGGGTPGQGFGTVFDIVP